MKWLIIFSLLTLSLFNQTNAEMKVISINNRPASEIRDLLLPLMQPDERAVASGSNLILRATPERLLEIQSIIGELDLAQENLLITVVQGRDISAEQFNLAAKVQAKVNPTDIVNRSFQIDAKIRKTKSKDRKQNTQTLKTIDGQPAHIKIGSAHPVQDVYVSPSRFGNPTVTSETHFLETSTGFVVTPRLVGNNQVILDIAPWSDSFNHRQIDTQDMHTVVRVRLGEWIEIGGNTENFHSDSSSLLAEVRTTHSQNTRVLIKVDKQ
jgi:hypothetical protein